MSAEEEAFFLSVLAEYKKANTAWSKYNKPSENSVGLSFAEMGRGTSKLASNIITFLMVRNQVFTTAIFDAHEEITKDFSDFGNPELSEYLSMLASGTPIGFTTMIFALTCMFLYDRSIKSTLRIKTYADQTRDPWMRMAARVLEALEGLSLEPTVADGAEDGKTANALDPAYAKLCPSAMKSNNWCICGPVLLPVFMAASSTKSFFMKAHEFYIKGTTAYGVFHSVTEGGAMYSPLLMDMEFRQYISRQRAAGPKEKVYTFLCQYIREVQGGRNIESKILRQGPLRAVFRSLLTRMKSDQAFAVAARNMSAIECDKALGFLNADGSAKYTNLPGTELDGTLMWDGLSLPAVGTVALVVQMEGGMAGEGARKAVSRPTVSVTFEETLENSMPADALEALEQTSDMTFGATTTGAQMEADKIDAMVDFKMNQYGKDIKDEDLPKVEEEVKAYFTRQMAGNQRANKHSTNTVVNTDLIADAKKKYNGW